jgi:hypothetical protein
VKNDRSKRVEEKWLGECSTFFYFFSIQTYNLKGFILHQKIFAFLFVPPN